MSTTSYKPRLFENEQYQRDIHLAVHAGWFRYAFSGSWLWTALPAWVAGAFLVNFYHAGANPALAWQHLLRGGFLTWGLGFLFAFRLLFRSIDRAGKRKLARQLEMLPQA